MKLIIDIPEDEYQSILLTGKASFCAVNAIEAGTPLPKRHGRLIDADELYGDFIDGTEGYDCQTWNRIEIGDIIEDAPTIIEADEEYIEVDKEYEVEAITRGNCMIFGKELTDGLFFCKECEDKSLEMAIDSLETWDKIFTEYEKLIDQIVAEGDEKHATERIDAWCIDMLRSVISDYYARRIIEDANRKCVESEDK